MGIRFNVASAVAALLVPAALAPAAIVKYTVAVNDDGTGTLSPGKFAVFADDSTGDNSGIATYGVALSGFLTITNQSPQTTYFKAGSPPSIENGGFTLLRSANNATTLTGAEDTTAPTTTVYTYGFGQTAGNLSSQAPSGFLDLGGTQEVYPAHLLLATGTYTVGGTTPNFVAGSSSTLANVFLNNTSTATIPATVTTQVTGTPEPSSLALAGAAGLLVATRRRRTNKTA